MVSTLCVWHPLYSQSLLEGGLGTERVGQSQFFLRIMCSSTKHKLNFSGSARSLYWLIYSVVTKSLPNEIHVNQHTILEVLMTFMYVLIAEKPHRVGNDHANSSNGYKNSLETVEFVVSVRCSCWDFGQVSPFSLKFGRKPLILQVPARMKHWRSVHPPDTPAPLWTVCNMWKNTWCKASSNILPLGDKTCAVRQYVDFRPFWCLCAINCKQYSTYIYVHVLYMQM